MNVSVKTKNIVFLVIRLTLMFSVIANILMALYKLFNGGNLIYEITQKGELIFLAIITLILSFSPRYVEKKNNLQIPEIFEIIIVLFIYASIFLSALLNLYYRFFWWDDLLHILSGIIIGFIGFIAIYKINYKYSMNINPALVMLFSFCFAITLGVFWEIFEFSSDVFFGTAHQKWDLPSTEIMIGKPYQGSGLRDTMSDLIVDSIGAFITSLITYFAYKNSSNKKKILKTVQKIIKNN